MKMLRRNFLIGFLIPLALTSGYGQQPQRSQTPGQQPNPAQQRQRAPEDSTIRMTHFQTEIWDPEIPMVQPASKPGDAPADAIVLFDGTNIEKEWEEVSFQGIRPATWIIKDGAMQSVKGSGSLKSKRVFNDFQLHIEWKTPSEITGSSQGRGNSGVYLQELYELQILDSWHNRTYRNGQAGAFYKQYAPLVNASLKPGEWQSYDIVYTAPRFGNDSASYFTPPRATVFHNGILIQNNVALRGPTTYVGIPEFLIKKHGPGSILLQQHGNPVAFRNIWIREL
ncbi:MAG TPA: DUF1080 domain-containing protein [Bacteroidales bacterium]|nr:DUF1080 domain-containing protein [Bacteroidales bacterium]